MLPPRFRLRSGHLWSAFTLACLLVAAAASVVSAAELPDDEVQALKTIASSLEKDWDFNVNPCSRTSPWNTSTDNVVTCNCTYSNNTVCHVTSVVLKRQSLQGTLPPEFASLPYLQNIDLTLNYINGTIPSEWGSLENLQNITLFGNRLNGSIPKEIGNISTLQNFNVQVNQLSGDLPEELGNLSQLRTLLLTSNDFTGALPSTFAKLTALDEVSLGDNQFSGPIPEFIQNWSNITTLVLAAAGFEGPIPSIIETFQNLNDLRITDLIGNETLSFPRLSHKNMEWLVLRNCNLVGGLPDYLENMTQLKTLDLSFNKLSGEIPTNSDGLNTVDYL
ncbi:hypothetical protein SAY86_016029 [Trapa natans]|uniref:Uncharacterized protein n=1 Tax=Trapa natans TaxID=22666 RepID=A0AAN7LKQ0_TRANT|nr:hypothetical protein SAY86_016029 [Trapa natans]